MRDTERRLPLHGGATRGDTRIHWTVRHVRRDPDGAGMQANVVSLVASPAECFALAEWHPFGPDMGDGVLDALADPSSWPEPHRRQGAFASWVAYLTRFGFDRNHGDAIERSQGDGSACTAQRKAFEAFAGGLDQRLVGALAEQMPLGLRSEVLGACWAGLDRTLSPGCPLGDAMEGMPGLESLVADAWLGDRFAFEGACRAGTARRFLSAWAVERGILPARLLPAARDLAAVIPAFDGVEASMGARRSPTPSNLHAYDRSPWHCLALDAVRRLVDLPASWVPRSVADWKAFALFGPMLDRFEGVVEGGEAWSRFLNHGGCWADLAARLSRQDGFRPCDAPFGFDDVARAYAIQVLAPAVAAIEGDAFDAGFEGWTGWTDAGFSMLASGRSLARLSDVSMRWHARANAMRAAIAGVSTDFPDPMSWPPGLPDATLGDVEVRVLRNERELVAEGANGADDGIEGLDHCVGGYAPQCIGTGGRVLSVRRVSADGNLRCMSTAYAAWDGACIDVMEHRGRGNREPSAAATLALDAYAAWVARHPDLVDADGLRPIPDGDPLRACGFDARDPEARSRVRDLWRGLVPGTVAGMDEAALAALARSLVGTRSWRPMPHGTPVAERDAPAPTVPGW